MKKIKIILLLISLSVVLACGVIFTISSVKKSKQVETEPIEKVPIDKRIISEHLSQAIKFRTITKGDNDEFNQDEFIKFQDYLEKAFPKLHSVLNKEVINNYSLLYTWKGKDDKLKPIILCAHMDVIPVDATEEGSWHHSPFSGDISEGYIWGRGARDDKSQLVAILESMEYLLSKGFQPERTVYVAFGHDEEVLGDEGAKKISALLKSRNVEPEFVIDEGGTIVNHNIIGINKPVALIGIEEKGYLSVELKVKAPGGHSAYAPEKKAIDELIQAITKIQDKKKLYITGGTKQMFNFLAPEMEFPYKQIFSNLWITGSLAKIIMSYSSLEDNLLKTTGIVTVFQGGFKDNALPSGAKAVINFRIIPGEKSDEIFKKLKDEIDNPDIEINPIGKIREPSSISSTDSKGFLILEKTIKQIFPGVLVSPYLASSTSDSGNYRDLTDNVYNFSPAIKSQNEVSHGNNERISVDNYEQYIQFYTQLITNYSH